MANTFKKSRRLSPLLATLLAVGVIVLVVAGLEITNTTHLFHHTKATSGVIPSTSSKTTSTSKQPSKTSSTSSSSTSSASDNTSTKSQQPNAVATSDTELVAPFGTLVSNHHPNLSGSPAPSQEQSVCQTNPGATCYIQFTSNGVVKTLAGQQADGNGVVVWNWDVKKAGFTEGSWQITATATQNGQTKSTKDTLNLEVGP